MKKAQTTDIAIGRDLTLDLISGYSDFQFQIQISDDGHVDMPHHIPPPLSYYLSMMCA